jgi:hypothetical protein
VAAETSSFVDGLIIDRCLPQSKNLKTARNKGKMTLTLKQAYPAFRIFSSGLVHCPHSNVLRT